MSNDNSISINREIVALLRDALAQAEEGNVIGCGIVLVKPKHDVTTSFRAISCYHALNSGAARLAARLALIED